MPNEQVNKLKTAMLNSTSPQEATYFSNQINKILDENPGSIQSKKQQMLDSELKLFNELVREMLNATDEWEVYDYEEQIHLLLDQIDERQLRNA